MKIEFFGVKGKVQDEVGPAEFPFSIKNFKN